MLDVIFFCNQLTGQRNEGRPPCSESVSCILRRLQKQLFVVGNLPRASRPSARERCRRRERGRGRGGQRRERPQVFPPLFLAACRAEPIKTFDTGRAGPRAENEKENFCQSRRWSVSPSGGKRTHSDLDLFRSGVFSPILPFT